MLSDVLFDAIGNIERWQEDCPDWYDSLRSEIDAVKSAMRQLQRKLDSPPPQVLHDAGYWTMVADAFELLEDLYKRCGASRAFQVFLRDVVIHRDLRGIPNKELFDVGRACGLIAMSARAIDRPIEEFLRCPAGCGECDAGHGDAAASSR